MNKRNITAVVLSLQPRELQSVIDEVNSWDNAFNDGTPTVNTARELINLLSKPEYIDYAETYFGTAEKYFEEVFGIIRK